MTSPHPALSSYRRNDYSQNGEDGVIAEIVARLDLAGGSFVEFGAHDGVENSNTLRLLQQGWTGVLIEADPGLYAQLVHNLRSFIDGGSLVPLNVEVEPTGAASLDALLAPFDHPGGLDFMSIDIDGLDLAVFREMQLVRPKVVLIELNSSYPPGVVCEHGDPGVQGSSFSAVLATAREKQYTPVCHIGNLFLVADELVDDLHLPQEHLDDPNLLFDWGWVPD